jgi:hypothetical protein
VSAKRDVSNGLSNDGDIYHYLEQFIPCRHHVITETTQNIAQARKCTFTLVRLYDFMNHNWCSLKERSPTLETTTMPRHSSKKPKAKATAGKASAGQAAEQNNVQTLVNCSAVKTVKATSQKKVAKQPESESSSGSSSDNP